MYLHRRLLQLANEKCSFLLLLHDRMLPVILPSNRAHWLFSWLLSGGQSANLRSLARRLALRCNVHDSALASQHLGMKF